MRKYYQNLVKSCQVVNFSQLKPSWVKITQKADKTNLQRYLACLKISQYETDRCVKHSDSGNVPDQDVSHSPVWPRVGCRSCNCLGLSPVFENEK